MRLRGAGTAALVVLLLALPGCTTPQAQQAPSGPGTTTPQVDVTPDRPDPTFGQVQTGPSAQPDTNASLAAPPRLVPGEWWRIKFHQPLDGVNVEFIRVVSDASPDSYVIGMPHEGWYKEALVHHAPAFGDQGLDLSYETHDVLFEPVKFPLTNDQTWKTHFSGGPEITAKVEVQDEQRAKVHFTDPSGAPFIDLVYDASIHEVSEFHEFTVEYQVAEHGYGFEGWTTVPRGEDLVFFNGRLAGALGFDLKPALPQESVEVKGGYNRVTFVQIVGDLQGPLGLTPDPLPGVYRETVTAPDGTKFSTEAIPGTFFLQFFEFPDPDGIWQMEHIAGGHGFSFTEGIAYHQYDIHLPDGARRADHSHKVIR